MYILLVSIVLINALVVYCIQGKRLVLAIITHIMHIVHRRETMFHYTGMVYSVCTFMLVTCILLANNVYACYLLADWYYIVISYMAYT